MKFTVEQSALADGVNWVSRSLSTRPIMTALLGIVIDASGDEVFLSGSDLETSSKAHFAADIKEKGKVLVLGWGSTYGTIKSAVQELQAKGKSVSHAHIKYLRPFPKNLGDIIKNFETVLIPEINNGQLIKIIRDQYFVDAKGYNKIMGIPITKQELVAAIESYL